MQRHFIVVSILIAAATTMPHGQTTSHPLSTVIAQGNLTIQVNDVFRLPDTRSGTMADREFPEPAWARTGYVRDLPDGRRFVSDLRGYVYLVEGTTLTPYLDFAALFPRMYFNRLEGGLISFTFHPEFVRNGRFYTVHTESGPENPAVPHFIPMGYATKDVTYHEIVTEWTASNPSAGQFAGTRRELLRIADVVRNLTHPTGDLEFNPNAKPGDADYGLLYISGSDHGFSNGGGPNASDPAQTQRLDSLMTAILRIDPRSALVTRGTKGVGDYTVPAGNTFAADANPLTLGEIYAYGFRNAHRLSWDTDGTMFASDVGMNQIEELNIVRNGGNYGWMRREGLFSNGRPTGGELRDLIPLPDEILEGRVKDGFTYPVAVYDHADGRAITSGFAYHGKIAALRGKFVFGDLVNGRVFVSDLAALKKADDGVPKTVAPIEEVKLYVRTADGKRVTMSLLDMVGQVLGRTVARADLHLSSTRDGELLLTTRQDGMVRLLVGDGQ